MSYPIRRPSRRYQAPATLLTLALALASTNCTGDNEDASCGWLFAPSSFVDAAQPGCTAQPAGKTCDPVTERCQSLCQPGEYLMTCRLGDVSRYAIPEEALQDPVVTRDHPIKCNSIDVHGEGSSRTADYCCQCAQ